jgi:hypothetical protein
MRARIPTWAAWPVLAAALPVSDEAAWPQWRGPDGTGASADATPPVTWSEEEHVRWKAPLPGKGHSSPIVWGDRVFLTAAAPFGEAFEPRPDTAPGAHDFVPVTHRHRYMALCFSREDGELLWERTLREAIPHEGGHDTGSYASASPVTDGERVYAYFGSAGLYCLDLDGDVFWERDLGEMRTKHAHGEAASPALHGDTLVVNWDHEGASFVVALDAETGEERWKVARDEVTSWATPIVAEVDGKPQVIVSGTTRLRGYDLATGEVVWSVGGLSHNVVASPVVAEGIVFAGSSYEKQAMIAVRLAGAKGDLAPDDDHLLWYRRRSTPYVPSPLYYEGWLYFLHHYQGFLSRVEAATGEEPQRPVRLPGQDDVYASPVAADGHIYVVDRSGLTIVLEAGAPPRIVARNHLDDAFSASPALVGKDLFLRGERFLYCLAD